MKKILYFYLLFTISCSINSTSQKEGITEIKTLKKLGGKKRTKKEKKLYNKNKPQIKEKSRSIILTNDQNHKLPTKANQKSVTNYNIAKIEKKQQLRNNIYLDVNSGNSSMYSYLSRFIKENETKLSMGNESGSYGIDDKKLKIWIEKMSKKNYKSIANFIAENIKYISFKEFINTLKNLAIEIVELIKAKKYEKIMFIVDGESKKSNTWVFLLLFKELEYIFKKENKKFYADFKNKCLFFDVIESSPDAPGLAMKHYENQILNKKPSSKVLCLHMDDMSYSGQQIRQSIISVYKKLRKYKNLDYYITIPYIGTYAKNKTLAKTNVKFFKSTKVLDSFKEILQKNDKYKINKQKIIEGFNNPKIKNIFRHQEKYPGIERVPVYFDYKIADALSIPHFIFALGCYPDNIDDFDSLIKNCKISNTLKLKYKESCSKSTYDLDDEDICPKAFYKRIYPYQYKGINLDHDEEGIFTQIKDIEHIRDEKENINIGTHDDRKKIKKGDYISFREEDDNEVILGKIRYISKPRTNTENIIYRTINVRYISKDNTGYIYKSFFDTDLRDIKILSKDEEDKIKKIEIKNYMKVKMLNKKADSTIINQLKNSIIDKKAWEEEENNILYEHKNLAKYNIVKFGKYKKNQKEIVIKKRVDLQEVANHITLNKLGIGPKLLKWYKIDLELEKPLFNVIMERLPQKYIIKTKPEQVINKLLQQLSIMKKNNFKHGDINPNNIIDDNFIDFESDNGGSTFYSKDNGVDYKSYNNDLIATCRSLLFQRYSKRIIKEFKHLFSINKEKIIKNASTSFKEIWINKPKNTLIEYKKYDKRRYFMGLLEIYKIIYSSNENQAWNKFSEIYVKDYYDKFLIKGSKNEFKDIEEAIKAFQLKK